MLAPVEILKEAKLSGLVLHHQFSGIDQLAEQLQPLALLRLTQLRADSLQSDIVLVLLGQIRITFTQFSCPIQLLGDKLRDWVAFSFDLTPDSYGIVSHGCKLSPDTIADFNSDLEFDAILPPEVWRATLQIQPDVLEAYLQIMGRFDLDSHFWATNAVVASAALPSLRLYFNQILDLALQKPAYLQRSNGQQLVENIIPLLINALPLTNAETLQPPLPLARSHLVKQADEYMISRMDQPLTLKDICDALGVSRRPLFYGFQEMFGTSPMEYLKARRLQGARQMLKAANPKTTTVAAIAQKFGFWSTGHFARDYKTMFGELPTETLNGRKLKRHLTDPVTNQPQ